MAGVAGFVVVGGGVADAGDEFFAEVDIAGDAAWAVGEQQLAVLTVDAVLAGAGGLFNAPAVAVVAVADTAGTGELVSTIEVKTATAVVNSIAALVITKIVATGDSADPVIQVAVA